MTAPAGVDVGGAARAAHPGYGSTTPAGILVVKLPGRTRSPWQHKEGKPVELYTIDDVASTVFKADTALVRTLIDAGYLRGFVLHPGPHQTPPSADPSWRCTAEALEACMRRLQEEQRGDAQVVLASPQPPVPASPQAHGRLPALVRINLKAAGQIDARHFCFTRGLVGMGWQVECDAEAQGPVLTWSHYVRLAQALYGAVWAPVQKLHDLPQGSIVWTREGYGDKTRFHVGMVVGPWRYLLEDREAEKADIVNVRDILWKEVGGYAAVPGGVARSFTPSTFQSIRDAEAISFSTTLTTTYIVEGVWPPLPA